MKYSKIVIGFLSNIFLLMSLSYVYNLFKNVNMLKLFAAKF